MDTQGEPAEYHFAFTLERRELEESLSYAVERALIERLPAAQRTYLRHGLLFLGAGTLLVIAIFVIGPGSLLFSFLIACALLAGIYAYGYLRMAHRKTLLAEWMKQSMAFPNESTMAYLLKPCKLVITPGGIDLHHPDARSELSWRAIRSVEAAALGIDLHLRNQGVCTVPTRLFNDAASRDRFVERVRAWHADALRSEPGVGG